MTEPGRYPRLFGKYVLVAPLARGGMGELHLAISGRAELKKLCAIKQILHYMVDANSVRRFIDEAKVMVKLSHGNVVPVFESGVIEGQYYLVMEFIEGKDLRAIWNTLDEQRKRCPIEATLLIAKEICRGLSYVHSFGELGLVHRDISPPNVLVSYSGEVKVADFGLAYSRLKVQKTAPGVLFGKLSYMAPEQARREPVDARADIFSVGVILWELATGRRLFPREGALRDQLKRAFDPRVELPSRVDPDLPSALDLIISRALAKHPDDRYPNAEMMRKDIAGLLAKLDPTADVSLLQRLLRELYGEGIAQERRARTDLLEHYADEILRLQATEEAGRNSLQPAGERDAWPDELEVVSERDIDTEASSENLEIGTVLGQRYRIEGLIGEGGMGVVYRATHIGIDKQVAIKILHPLYSWMPEVVSRFQHEAKAASRIGHPNIVEIYDSGTTDDGCLYFAMEYLEGEDLADVLAHEGPLPIPRALNIGIQICRALHAAHDAGIVHRDLKPENVFLVAKAQHPDFVKVLDFGVAQNMRLDPERHERLTSPGTAMGTPEYMSPEQAAGKSCDHRADVYAVGSILYEMLAGQPPDHGQDTMEVFNRKASGDHEPLSELRADVSDQLTKVIQWAIEYRAADRPQSLGHLAYELTKISEGRPTAVASVLGLTGSRFPGARALPPPLPPAIGDPGYSANAVASGQFPAIGEGLPSQLNTAVVPTVQRPGHTARNVAVGVALVTIGITVGALTLRGEIDDADPPEMGAPGPDTVLQRAREAPGTSVQPTAPERQGAAGREMPHAQPDALPKAAKTLGAPDRRQSAAGSGLARSAKLPGEVSPRARSTGAAPVAPPAKRDDTLALAEQHLLEGRFSDAREAFEQARTKPWQRESALLGLGRVAFQEGKLREAETYARLAAQRSRSPAAALLLANIEFKRGRYDIAANLYRDVLATAPDHAEARRNLDAALKRGGLR